MGWFSFTCYDSKEVKHGKRYIPVVGASIMVVWKTYTQNIPHIHKKLLHTNIQHQLKLFIDMKVFTRKEAEKSLQDTEICLERTYS